MRPIKNVRFLRMIIVGLLATLLVLCSVPARAAETRGGDTIIIGREDVINSDLYLAANIVTVDGTINGDLVAAGSLITVNGTVTGDVLAVGQRVVVNGTVRDDVRIAGHALVVGPTARVGGDLFVGGLSLENQPGSTVQGDLLVGAYQVLMAGMVGQRVLGGVDRMELRGTVGGDVDLSLAGDPNTSAVQFMPAGQAPIPALQPNLTVAESAQIGGQLLYRSPTEVTIPPQAQIAGGVHYEQTQASTSPPPPAAASNVLWLSLLRRLVSLVLVGLLLLWLAPVWMGRMSDMVEERLLPSLGWGAVALFAFIGVLVGVLVLTILLTSLFGSLTLGGLAGMTMGTGLLGIFALILGYIGFSVYVAEGVVAYTAGRWLLRRVLPAWAEHPAAMLGVGLVLYIVLSAVPVLGAFVGLAVVLLALGALWLWARSLFRRAHPTPPPAVSLQPA